LYIKKWHVLVNIDQRTVSKGVKISQSTGVRQASRARLIQQRPCGHVHQIQVASSPSQPEPLDWFEKTLSSSK
jgi:hypothetical protein